MLYFGSISSALLISIINIIIFLQGPGDMLGLVSAEYVNKFLFVKLLTFVYLIKGHTQRPFGMGFSNFLKL